MTNFRSLRSRKKNCKVYSLASLLVHKSGCLWPAALALNSVPNWAQKSWALRSCAEKKQIFRSCKQQLAVILLRSMPLWGANVSFMMHVMVTNFAARKSGESPKDGVGGWMNEWMNERTNERRNEWMNDWCHLEWVSTQYDNWQDQKHKVYIIFYNAALILNLIMDIVLQGNQMKRCMFRHHFGQDKPTVYTIHTCTSSSWTEALQVWNVIAKHHHRRFTELLFLLRKHSDFIFGGIWEDSCGVRICWSWNCSGRWFAVEMNKTWTPRQGYLSYLQMVGVGARVADGRQLGSLSSLQEWSERCGIP